MDDAFLSAALPFWHPVAYTNDLQPGTVRLVRLLAEEVALWRSADGTVHALTDCCIHRGTRLSAGVVNDGCVRCPYHGWEYDGEGRCTRIPQLPDGPIPERARVEAFRAEDRGGITWICLVPPGSERAGIPALPHDGAEGWHVYCGTAFDIACQSGRQIENTFDFAHFSVLHADIFGDPDRPEVGPYEARPSADGLTLETDYTYRARHPAADPGPDGTKPTMVTRYRYRISLPFVSTFTLEIEGEPTTTIMTANQPVTATTSRVWWVVELRAGEVADELVEAVNWAILMQDKPVVEGQRPVRLPLDPASELQMPFDRLAVAYRRMLADLGFPRATTGPAPEP